MPIHLAALATKTVAAAARSRSIRQFVIGLTTSVLVVFIAVASVPSMLVAALTPTASAVTASHCSRTQDQSHPSDEPCGTVPAGDAQLLAQQLELDMQSGRLLGSSQLGQIRDIARGIAVPDCGVDTRILQMLIISLDTFNSVAVSDINRRCIGSLEGAGTASAHYIDGGGHAIDLYAIDGLGLTGNDPNSRRLLATLDPHMPPGSRAGQSNCRSDHPLVFANLRQFEDTCNHLHIDVAFADGGTLD